LDHFDNQLLTYTVMAHNWLNQPGFAALFTISFLASTVLPLGSEWLLVMMLSSGFDPVLTIGTATVGNYLGAVTTYLIGMFGGNLLITRFLRVSAEQHERARSHYRRFGVFTLFFSWLPVVGDPLCMVGGVLRVNFWIFTLLVASGKLLRYTAVAFITLRVAD
jgi:membrane protein YqaA with SNARE-associated domain